MTASALKALGLVAALLAAQPACATGQEDRGTEPTSDAAEQMLKVLGVLPKETVKEIYSRLQESEKASALAAAGNAKGLMETRQVQFLDGAPAVKLLVAANRVATIKVVDRFGTPWPITKAVWAPGGSFSNEQGAVNGNAITLVPAKRFMRGNGVIFLKGTSDEIHINFETSEKQYDERMVLAVQKQGPVPSKYASLHQDGGAAKTSDSTSIYYAFYNQAPPAGAAPIKLKGEAPTKAWRFRGKMVVKTEAEVISPIPLVRLEENGVKVFAINPLEVVVVDYYGKMTNLHVEAGE